MSFCMRNSFISLAETLLKMLQELEYLYGLKKFGIKPGLDAIRKALDRLGNPQDDLRIIHVAGTNGKGSTCAMVAGILQRAGHTVGLFTSPHLVDFCERIQVDRQKIPEADVLRLVNGIKALDVPLTFFEFVTVMAILYFKEQGVDFVVLEVGLGGSWDATNICDGEICAITSISLDHTRILGDTIEKIAEDKCGIIKPGSRVVVGESNKALGTIKRCASNEQLVLANRYAGKLGLNGDFQRDNAGIAYEVGRLLEIDDRIIRDALAQVDWPGRLQMMRENILVDCAHNPDAIEAARSYVKALGYGKLIVVFGVLADKDYRKMIKLLPKPDFLILTQPRSERALDPVQLAHDGKCAVIEDPAEAIRYAKGIAKDDDLIFVTGSIFLVGSIRELLR